MVTHIQARSYKLPTLPCRNCRAPIVIAISLAAEDTIAKRGEPPVRLDAVPLPAGDPAASAHDYVIAAWRVHPNNATYVVRWNDSEHNADEPVYRRHRCQRSLAK